MRKRKVKKLAIALFVCLLGCPLVSAAGLGDADFPKEAFGDGPQSNHQAWCRTPRNKCQVLFRGPALWVAKQGGILSSQFISYRYNRGRGEHSHEHLFYNYLIYKSSLGEKRTALFLFVNGDAQRKFARSLFLWKRQVSPNNLKPEIRPLPNF